MAYTIIFFYLVSFLVYIELKFEIFLTKLLQFF